MRETLVKSEDLKNSPLSIIQSDWDTVSIDSITVHVGSGVTPRGGSNVYKKEGILFIRSQNVAFNGLLLNDVAYIDTRTHKKMKRSEVFAHDVLLNITGASIGRCCPVPEGLGTTNVNQHVCAIRIVNPNREDAIFLSCVLASHIGQSQISRLNAGGNREGLNYEQLRAFIIPFPPPKERASIAKILNTMDEAITRTESLIAKLKQMKAGLLHDLLTCGLDENEQLRDVIAHPERFKDSLLGKIPNNWECKPLGEITLKVTDRDHTTPQYIDEGVIMVSPVNLIGDKDINFAACKRISYTAHLQNRKKTDIRCGDIILHRIGAGLGQVRLVTQEMPEFSILHSLALVRPDENLVIFSYLLWAFRTHKTQIQMELGTQSIGVPDLGLDKISGLLFPVPPRLEQKRIADVLNFHQERIRTEEAYRNKLKLLKKGLIHDLLTGKIRVNGTNLVKEDTDEQQ